MEVKNKHKEKGKKASASGASVKPGFKHTSIGWIPEEWNVMTVSEAFKICNNLRFPINEGERQKIKGKYPYYGPTKIQDYLNVYRVEGKYALIGEDGDHFLKWKEMPMTLLVEGRFNVNNHAHLIRGEENLTEWFFYFFNHRPLTQFLTRQGAGRYKLTKEALAKMPIAIPPRDEQKHLTHLLSTWDKAIHNLQLLIEKKEQRKKWLMQQLLTGKKRLKGFKGKWIHSTIGEQYDLINGMAFKPTDWVNSGYPIIRIQNLNGSKEFNYYDSQIPEKYIVKTGSILFSWSGSRGTSFGSFKWNGPKGVLNQHIFRVISKGNINDEFGFLMLRYITEKIENKAHGSAGLVHVTKAQLEKEMIHYPEFKEQIAIANLMSMAENEIEIRKQELETLKQQKRGLMQILLTGKKQLKHKV